MHKHEPYIRACPLFKYSISKPCPLMQSQILQSKPMPGYMPSLLPWNVWPCVSEVKSPLEQNKTTVHTFRYSNPSLDKMKIIPQMKATIRKYFELLAYTELNKLLGWTACYSTFDQLSKHGADQMTICSLFKQLTVRNCNNLFR